MAVYYKWIKGCATNANLSSGLWSYLKWGEGTSGTSVNNLPTLYTSNGRVGEPSNSLGYVLTNDATGVNINKEWVFNNNIKMNNSNKGTSLVIASHQDFYKITTTNDFCFLSGGSIALGVNLDSNFNYRCIHIVPPSKKDSFDNARVNILSDLYIGGSTTNENYIAHFSRSGAITIKAPLEVKDNPVLAQFFNATSDKRAKENIQPAVYKALDLINKLPVYTYNYKNNTETVTGILAQDLLEAQPKELDLVSNINASGENGDYMSIKNDKFMFVLMKAIQEQQEKINHLEEELNKLKNN